jgi:hypothetical protein
MDARRLAQTRFQNRITFVNLIEYSGLTTYEDAVAKTIENLNAKREEISERIQSLYKEMDEIPRESWMDETIVYSTEELNLINELGNLNIDEESITAHLKVLNEMKVVHLFREVEVKIKLLIETAYTDVSVKTFHNWDSLSTFLKSKGIEIKNIESFDDVNSLRKVNNAVKHQHRVNSDLKKILEFAKVDELDSDSLDQFYSRIKPSVKSFLNKVSQSIWNDLYVFDEERLTQIVKSYNLRMDAPVIKKLAEKLIRSIGVDSIS